MNSSGISRKWQALLQSEGASVCTQKEIPLSGGQCCEFMFPVSELKLVVESRRLGSIFTYEDALRLSAMYLLASGFLAIGSSTAGNILIVNLIKDHGKYGLCRWLRGAHLWAIGEGAFAMPDFDSCEIQDSLTEYMGYPWTVIKAMKRPRYHKDDEFLYMSAD